MLNSFISVHSLIIVMLTSLVTISLLRSVTNMYDVDFDS